MRWGRQYPPLFALAAAIVLAVFALPSSLNLPQASPAQTLEYAPVPPNGNAPPGGNFSSLGLADSSTLGAAPAGGVLGQPPGAGANPSNKECVGTPPRETEDPLSPPCVPYFGGDNGGATYAGVTGKEVRIVFYLDGGISWCTDGANCSTTPIDTYVDLDQAPSSGEHWFLPLIRAWERYFNERYQTYGRHAHIWVFFGRQDPSISAATPDTRRQDAADNFARIHPFATLDFEQGYADAYRDYLAGEGVLSFGGHDLRTAASFTSHPGLEWDFPPPVERIADEFGSLLCASVARRNAEYTNNPAWNGQPRKYGLLYADDPAQPEYALMADRLQKDVAGCGIKFSDVGRDPANCADGLWVGSACTSAATQNMALFLRDGVTTVVWPGGWEENTTNEAASIGYYPEWITGDFRGWERFEVGAVQDQGEWAHAFVVTPQTLQNDGGFPVEPDCMNAFQTVEPPGTDPHSYQLLDACFWYDSLRQLFTGIQVAGPRLSSASLGQGFRAIPAHSSSSPLVPACFYPSGDYTCDKDAVLMWWDPTAEGAYGQGPSTTKGFSGCWREGNRGTRYLPGDWPRVDLSAYEQSGDLCNLSDQY